MSLQSIREALARHGPLTSAQLCARVKLGPSSVCSQLKTLRETKDVHIKEWLLWQGGGAGSNTPVFSLGDAPDAISPSRVKPAEKVVKALVQPKVNPYAAIRQQAGMWGGLICSA